MMKNHIYVAISGPVGVGKTTITEKTTNLLSAIPIYERLDIQPFLEDFRADPTLYSFETSTWFLLTHYHQLHVASHQYDNKEIIISDFCIYHDRFFAEVELSKLDLNAYLQIYNYLTDKVIQPDIVFLLMAPLQVCENRILKRNRQHDIELDKSYFELIYNKFQQPCYSQINNKTFIIDTNLSASGEDIHHKETTESIAYQIAGHISNLLSQDSQ